MQGSILWSGSTPFSVRMEHESVSENSFSPSAHPILRYIWLSFGNVVYTNNHFVSRRTNFHPVRRRREEMGRVNGGNEFKYVQTEWIYPGKVFGLEIE